MSVSEAHSAVTTPEVDKLALKIGAMHQRHVHILVDQRYREFRVRRPDFSRAGTVTSVISVIGANSLIRMDALADNDFGYNGDLHSSQGRFFYASFRMNLGR